MRRMGLGAVVLLCALLFSHAALADRNESRTGVAGRSPWGVAASDLNGDGKLDLATVSASASKAVTVFVNRGAGRFRRAGAYS